MAARAVAESDGRDRVISPRVVFGLLGRFVVRFRYYVVLAWIFGTALVVFNLPSLADVAKTGDTAFLPPSTPSVAAQKLVTP